MAEQQGKQEKTATRETLDAALRAHAEKGLKADGEVIVGWIALAAVRRFDGNGGVIYMPSSGVMPLWEARGILHEALAAVERSAARERDEG